MAPISLAPFQGHLVRGIQNALVCSCAAYWIASDWCCTGHFRRDLVLKMVISKASEMQLLAPHRSIAFCSAKGSINLSFLSARCHTENSEHALRCVKSRKCPCDLTCAAYSRGADLDFGDALNWQRVAASFLQIEITVWSVQGEMNARRSVFSAPLESRSVSIKSRI